MAPSNRARRFEATSEPTQSREDLERRWRDRLVPEPRLATMVTAEGSAREPFHRWLPYRQGFSPGMVRLFLAEQRVRRSDLPILDPFSGSGTTVTECARRNHSAIGVEALPALAFLTEARFAPAWIDLPFFEGGADRNHFADQLELPLHRAALMIAEARRHTASGALNRGAPTLACELVHLAALMREDLGHPLPQLAKIFCDDARSLTVIEDQSVGGILTSPPYLSRYDYAATNDPIQTLFRHWYGDTSNNTLHAQLRASPGRNRRSIPGGPTHHAAREAWQALLDQGHRRQADAIAGYFSDMVAVLAEMERVLASAAGVWLVVGGVRLKEIYVPTDLIVAELAETQGLNVDAMRVARELNPIRRKFGRCGHLAPRETLMALSKP